MGTRGVFLLVVNRLGPNHAVCTILFNRSSSLYGHTYNKSSMDQSGKVANTARSQLDRENEYFPAGVRA